MLTISHEQLRKLQLRRDQELSGKLQRKLELDYPEDCAALGPEALASLIRGTLLSAASRRILAEASILDLLRLCLDFGRDLEFAPSRRWANEMLDNPALPGTIKVNLVCQRLYGLTQGRRVITCPQDC